MNLTVLISSKIRQRILIELSKTRSIRMMTLVRRVNAKYNEVDRNLKILETEGIIINEYQNNPRQPKARIIRLQENCRTQKLLTALNDLREDNKPYI